MLQAALGRGFNVVLANKRPLAGSWASYTHLLKAAADAGRTIRFEATVGAGLPVIDTHKKLAETGDRVLRIDGCVSGTLMFVLSEVSQRPAVLGGGRSTPCSAATPSPIRATTCRGRTPPARA